MISNFKLISSILILLCLLPIVGFSGQWGDPIAELGSAHVKFEYNQENNSYESTDIVGEYGIVTVEKRHGKLYIFDEMGEQQFYPGLQKAFKYHSIAPDNLRDGGSNPGSQPWWK